MQFTAHQIATLVGGKLTGNEDAAVSRVAKIEEAGTGALSFIANPKYEDYLYTTQASILIISDALVPKQAVAPTLIAVKDPYSAFTLLLEKYHEAKTKEGRQGIEQPSCIAPTVKMGEGVYVGAFSYISDGVVLGNNVQVYPGCYIGENVQIADDVRLLPGVKIYNDCVIGARVVIHSGSVIGGDGFGFAPQADGTYHKIPQTGNVVIEDDVEIGVNTTIDRATMGSTRIHRGVKLDNLIQIGHNVDVDENTVIAAQSGISGSTKIGKNCMIGGQVGMVGHIQIADGVRIGAQSGLSKSVSEPGSAVNSTPAFDYKSSLKSHLIYKNLPDLAQRISKLEAQIEQLLQHKPQHDTV